MRREQEIFDELAALCTSPGYVHTIAYFCFRDTIVRYKDEMTAADMQHLFSAEHLVRTEISTLIGLLIKKEIDYALPTPEATQQYIARTQELLEEMHRVMSNEMFAGLDLKEIVEKGLDPFGRGAAFREPIFYAGESGYWFQYRDLSPRKYGADDDWLKSNRGFSIQAARDVVDALGNLQNEKLEAVVHGFHGSDPSQWTLLPGFSFTVSELSANSGIDEPTLRSVLVAFTLPDGERNDNFRALNDFNTANATPLIRVSDETFILFQQYSIAEALYDSPFYWMSSDDAYRATAMRNRGRFTEEFSKERLGLVFGAANVRCNVDVYERKGKKVGEIDVLVIFGDRAIVLQAKSKRLTLEARKGNDNQIKDDFKKSVQDSYDQGYDCATLLSRPNLKFIDGSGKVVALPRKLAKVYILCVVSDNYPALSFQSRQFLRSQTSEIIQAPFVMDIFTLDVMTEMLDSPLYFLSYIDRRTGYSLKLLASHELVVLSQHLKRNLWFEEKYDMVQLEDDISVDLDVAMSVRRDNIPGKRTPDGILTRIAHTALGSILKQIEARPDPGTIGFGFMLLTLSEHAITEISKAIELVAGRAREDGANHDVSVPLDEADAGLTVHCNNESISSAGRRLEGHCRIRKYACKATNWYGICIQPNGMSLRFGLSLNYGWRQDADMDAMASRLRKPSSIANFAKSRSRKKIGRNDPCPCGSGKKYKKCCLK
jgi:SEC-C motif